MADFKQMIEDVDKLAHKDLGTAISFRDMLEDIASLLNSIEYNSRRRTRWIDVIVVTLLLLNLMTTVALYNLIR